MKAFILKDKNEAVISEIEEPIIRSEYGAILRPVIVSVCTSDVNTVYGTGSRKPKGLVLGHECVAEIIKCGNSVKDFSVGDIVAVPSMTPDWRSKYIQDGNFLHAEQNFSANALGRSINGVFAEKFYLEDIDLNVARVENIDLKDALMCVDMASTAFTGVKKADINFGDKVCVIGIGGVGLLAVRAAYLSGASQIIAVGSKNNAFEIAKRFGADRVINYKQDNYVESILKDTNYKGVDAVIICGGTDEVIDNALKMVKYGTGRVVNLKHFPGNEEIKISKFDIGRGMSGKSLHFELGNGGRVMLERMLDLVRAGRMSPKDIITHDFTGFESIPECLELMRDKGNSVIKTVITL